MILRKPSQGKILMVLFVSDSKILLLIDKQSFYFHKERIAEVGYFWIET